MTKCKWCNREIKQKKEYVNFCNGACYYKQWRKKNLEKSNNYKREWYLENRKKTIMKSKKWAELNPEKVKKSKNKYFSKNKKKIYEKLELYKINNPEKYKAKYLAQSKIPIGKECGICKKKKVRLERHHWRYDKPYLVSTLCVPCHKIQHTRRIFSK